MRRFARHAVQQELIRRVGQFDFGPHHKHAQALEGLCQQVAAANQQDVLQSFSALACENNKTGLHAPLGVAKRRKACRAIAQL